MRETCSKCGSIYEVRREKLPMRDHDKEVCDCSYVLRRWNGAEMWVYTKVKDERTQKKLYKKS